jgi:hypothetical protein
VNFQIYGIIFLKRIQWNGSMGRGPGPRCSAHGSTEPASKVGPALSDGCARLKREGVRLLGCRK